MYLAYPLKSETVDDSGGNACGRVRQSLQLYPTVYLSYAFLLQRFLHNCLQLIDQVLHASWAAPSRYCVSAQLLLAVRPC